jgi:membrane-associated phospholipid phosphatase
MGGLMRALADHAYWLLPLTVLVILLSSFVDRPLALWFKSADPQDIAFFVDLNDSGNSQWYLVPTGILGLGCLLMAARMAFERRRRVIRWIGGASLFVFTAVAVSGLVVNVLKVIFARARPRLLFNEGEYGWHFFRLGSDFNSFPSGHANTMIALALALGCLVPRARPAFLIVAVPLAFARVVNTNHFLSDVIAGAVVAVLTTEALHRAFAARGWVFQDGRHGRRPKPEGRWALARLLRPVRRFGRLWP